MGELWHQVLRLADPASVEGRLLLRAAATASARAQQRADEWGDHARRAGVRP